MTRTSRSEVLHPRGSARSARPRATGGFALLLDLHNVYTECKNEGLDPHDLLAELDLGRVVELHVSGGSESDPAWLPGARTFRLDSHDGPVPEEVWGLLEAVLPRCPALRAVVVERMTGTLDAARAADYREEARRARRLVLQAHERGRAEAPRRRPGRALARSLGPLRPLQEGLLELVTAADPRALQAQVAARPGLAALGRLDPDGLVLTAKIVRKLRFERLLQGSREAAFWFERAPGELVGVFEAYCRAEPWRAFFPSEEAARFEAWAAGS